jgi:hypothetical protein
MGLGMLSTEQKQAYLEKQGFRSEVNDGRILVWRDGERSKSHLDAQSGATHWGHTLLSNSGSIASIGLQTLVFLPKVAGAIFAPMTGGSSLLLGMAASGLIATVTTTASRFVMD